MDKVDLIINYIHDQSNINVKEFEELMSGLSLNIDKINEAFRKKEVSPFNLCSIEKAETLKTIGIDPTITDKDFTPLIENRPKTVQWLVENGYNINWKNNNDDNALFYVNNAKNAEILIKGGININNQNLFGETALFVNRYPEVISSLIKAGIDVSIVDKTGATPLFGVYNPEKLDLLLKTNIDRNVIVENEVFYLTFGKKLNEEDIFDILVNNNVDLSFVSKTYNDRFISILYHITNPNILKKHGDLFRDIVNEQNIQGETALFYARSTDMLNELLKIGADINHKKINGNTILYGMHSDMIERDLPDLIKKGLDINSKNKAGHNALVNMSESSFCIPTLIENGIDYEPYIEKLRRNPELVPLLNEREAIKHKEILNEVLVQEPHNINKIRRI